MMNDNKVTGDLTDLVAKTPLIHLKRITRGLPGQVLAKVEAFNPGNSAKDRSALYMINEAERKGLLKPGDTIIEATSGNMGFSIAMISASRGYKCILTVKDSASLEKLSMLKVMGAKIILCPANVDSTNPKSYYRRAEKLAKDLPNSFYLNQNFNTDNAAAHYHSTGPEIWQQTEGKITHFICCGGTCGTLVGTSRYLKEQNPNIEVIGVDSYGSALKKFHEENIYDRNEVYSKKVEGLGKDIIPGNYDRSVIDRFVKVTDKESAIRARELCKNEGLFIGYSSGSAYQAYLQVSESLPKDAVVVMLFSDHGSRYLSKIYCDTWMEKQGFDSATYALAAV